MAIDTKFTFSAVIVTLPQPILTFPIMADFYLLQKTKNNNIGFLDKENMVIDTKIMLLTVRRSTNGHFHIFDNSRYYGSQNLNYNFK